tara:strand:- start:489 stop:2042 length:1554 start_codon:yes stop_codon:yes gene_type:complete
MESIEKEIKHLENLLRSKKLTEAQDYNESLIRKYPKTAYLYNFMGIILVQQKKIDDGIKYYLQGIKIQSNYYPLYDNLGTAYRIKENYTESELNYKKAISLDKNAVEPKNNLGNLYSIMNKHSESIECYKDAINIKPNFFASHYNLGIIYKNSGDFKKAKEHLKKSIDLNKNFYTAHRSLSELIKYKLSENHLNLLNNLYKDQEIGKKRKTELVFALGKANEDLGNYKKSFTYFKEANELRNNQIKFNINNEIKLFSSIKNIFNKKNISKLKKVSTSDVTPIFILGMPRSGTSLIEQIVSSHKEVYGGGELNAMDNLTKKNIIKGNDPYLIKNIENLDVKLLNKIAKNYIQTLKKISNSSEKVTDKLPINFKWIGLIKCIFPNSIIIHCIRNPKDTCFSIYKNYFVNTNLDFAYNLTDLCKYYKLYIDLMKHWKKIMPKSIIDVKYENIVNNPEKEIKKLIKSCKLNWDKNCLKFYNNKRYIKTASDTQVRRKIYKSSLDSWKNYKSDLESVFKTFF